MSARPDVATTTKRTRPLRTVHPSQILLSAAQTAFILGRAKPKFYKLLREEDTFPRPIRLSPESFPQWIKDEVLAWVASRPRA